MAPKPRLSIGTKIEIINKVARGGNIARLSREYNVTRRCIYKYLEDQNELLQFAEESKAHRPKKISKPYYRMLETEILDWFKVKRAARISISNKAFQKKAAIISKDLAIPNFKASNGWLEKIKKRNNIRTLAVTGELLDSIADEEVFTYLRELENYIHDRDLLPCQIYNSDETALFYKSAPKKH